MEIIGISDRQRGDGHERSEGFRYDGLFDRRAGKALAQNSSNHWSTGADTDIGLAAAALQFDARGPQVVTVRRLRVRLVLRDAGGLGL